MYQVNILNKINNKIFSKNFIDRNKLNKFIKKLKYSKNLVLLSTTDNSYLYD